MSIHDFLEQQKLLNKIRKQRYPGWPTHKTYLHTPDGETHLLFETVPVKQLRKRHYCKYCYTDHKNWWLMDPKDYNSPNCPESSEAILCGNCEHVSMADTAEID